MRKLKQKLKKLTAMRKFKIRLMGYSQNKKEMKLHLSFGKITEAKIQKILKTQVTKKNIEDITKSKSN
jgi:hypothetical protein